MSGSANDDHDDDDDTDDDYDDDEDDDEHCVFFNCRTKDTK